MSHISKANILVSHYKPLMIQLTHESFKEIAYLIRNIKQNFFCYDLKCASIASFHK